MFFVLTICLVTVCLIGDTILFTTKHYMLKALVDNLTHSLVAILSWLIILLKCHVRSTLIKNSVFEMFLCGLIASIIDVDHFLLAKSFKFQNALHLGKKRPPLHCTTLVIVMLLSFLLAGYILDSPRLSRFGWITWVSIVSHHIRDGSRRGIWLWPFGSTQPLPYFLYIFITLCLPYFVMIPLKGNFLSPAKIPITNNIIV